MYNRAMNKPLIILGAGASHDFLKISRQNDQHILNQWKPPLTNGIFDAELFSGIIGKYEDVKQLASAVSNLTDGTNPFDFEEYLTNLESSYPENNYKKIMALRFYLAELFGKISYYFYRHISNHNHLIYEIQNRGLKACFVNYNYDTLLEKNIPSIISGNNIDSYIQGDIKVIKIHGAHNWRHSPKITPTKDDVYDFFISDAKKLYEEYKEYDVDPSTIKNFDFNSEDFSLNIYRENKENGFPGGNWLYYLPAIAIPIGTKGNHVCPKTHIEILIEEIKQVDRILVIGWRAQDEYLLKLLKENLNGTIKITIVSGNEAHAQETALKFKDIQQIRAADINASKSEGYTNFMVNREYEEFLK
jgi:hypothetical protein